MAAMTEYRRAGLTFDVEDAGPADGEAIILLHGFPANRSSWDGVAPILNQAGFRTLAPDQRGYSPRARPRDRRAYRIDELADDVIALLDAADIQRAHIVGHDWGGGVAWELAATHHKRVASLTAVSTPHPRALMRSMVTSTQAFHSWYMVAMQLPWLPERMLLRRPRRGGEPLRYQLMSSGLSQDVAVEYCAHLADPAALTAAINWYRALPLAPPWRAAHDITVPTTYVWGSADPVLGRKAAELTGRFVGGPYRFAPLEGVGHWVPETEAETLAPLILERVGDAG